MSLPWKSSASSSGSKPWESSSGTSGTKPWESTSSSSRSKPWESTSNSSGKKPWESTAITKKQPWIAEKKFNDWFKKTFPAIKDDGTSLLNDFGLKDFVLSEFGTIIIPDTAGAIAALLISAASVLGGVALIVVSAGAATPAVAAGWGALAGTVLGVGLSGTVNASMGLANKNFRWESWGSEVGITAAASLITLPTCFFGGQAITGVLMTMSAKVTENVAKAVATTVGGIVGSGVHSGAYVLQCEVNGKPIEPLGVVLSGVGGFFEGTSAAYLGAKLVTTKFNSYKGIKTTKFSQDNTKVEVFKVHDEFEEALRRIDEGREFFPENKPFSLSSSSERLGKVFGSPRSTGTASTVSLGRESTWVFDTDVQKGVNTLAEGLAEKAKWVRVSSQSRKVQNVLSRDGGRDLLFLEHSGPGGYGAFKSNEAEGFANMVKKMLKRDLELGKRPDTLTLLGCDVPREFALDLQSKLSEEFDHKVLVKTLPYADESTRLTRLGPIDDATWSYGKKIENLEEFEKMNPTLEGTMRLRKDPKKDYLRQGGRGKFKNSKFRQLADNTDFFITMFTTKTDKLPEFAEPVTSGIFMV